MSRHSEFPTRRFFRDTKNGMVGGVCAGIADYFGFDVSLVRIITFISILFLGTPLLIYIALVLIVPRKPQSDDQTPAERAFHSAMRRAPKATFSEVSYRFRDLDSRLQRMERYVTSRRFQLDREFDRLKNG